MSDTSRVGLFYVDESTWGTTPGSALTELRKTSMNFRPIIETAESQEIIDDAQLRDLIQVGAAAEFDMAGELSYGTYDAQLSALLRSAWPGSAVSVSVSIAAAAADNSFTDAANGFVTAGFLAGQIIRTSGFTNPVNNGYFTVVSVVAGKIVVAGATLITETAGTRTIKGTPLLNGTTVKSQTFEEKIVNSAGAEHFLAYKGCRIGSMSLELVPGAISNIGFGGLGKEGVSGSATVGTGGPTAATTTDVMNTIGHMKAVRENNAAITLTRIQMNVNNNLRRRSALGVLGATGIGLGEIRVEGQISMYLEDRTLIDKAINQTASSLMFVVEDAASNTYGFHLPRIKYGQPEKVVQGKNQDYLLTLPFTAMRHPTIGKTIALTRIPA